MSQDGQPMETNRDQMHKTISRWQLLELIGLGNEAGLEGAQIRQILASEYGVNPDYTSRVLIELVQKGYIISQPAPQKNGMKGGHRKVYIRTDKANDLPDKPIPAEPVLAVKSAPSSQASRTEIDAPTSREEAQAIVPTTLPTEPETLVTETTPPSRQETGSNAGPGRRRGPRPITEAAAQETDPQQNLPYAMPEVVAASEGMAEPSLVVASTPVSDPTIQPGPEASPAPVEPEPASVETPPPAPDTPPHEVTPSATTTVHEALATAMDQFSDLLLLQVAHKLGAFVANQMAPLERATGELCAQIDVIRAQLDTITQHLGTLAAVPVPPSHHVPPSTMDRPAPTSIAVPQGDDTASTVRLPTTVTGQGRNKNGKKAAKTLAEQRGGLRPTAPGQRKLKALLIGVSSEQEQPIRDRFGGRYDLLFLGAEARFGKVRAIKDQYEIVLGLEDSCSPAIKDALKGHPHKAILPQPSQLMDELEEYFQLHLEQSQTGSVG